MINYSSELESYRAAHKAFGLKGNCPRIVAINANQILAVRFPKLGASDVIVPTPRLA